MPVKHRMFSMTFVALAALAIAVGCDKDSETKKTADGKTGGQATEQAGEGKKKAPLIQVARTDWCPEHGVWENVCTLCRTGDEGKKLVAQFKEKGDWCEEHGLPESHCFQCNPDQKETFAAEFRKKYNEEPPAMEESEGGHEGHDHDHDEKDEAGEKGGEKGGAKE